ncbi:MAG TPA: acyl-CoA dehydrogenase family protein [Smithellaceae bacterium]|nr:acyl-CoA dehydrogenase family protein [Smithellaceae bacterium]HQK28370.1 acyl-CoA dehydrogenase family protein [Smithellaceae bacterium]
MIGFDLTEELLSHQKMAREFAEKEIIPYAAELDRRPGTVFDWNIVRRFAKTGLLGLNVPKEYGGLGVDMLTAVIVAEEIGTACLGIMSAAAGNWLATTCLKHVGTENQKRRYFPMCCGENAGLAALALTEHDAGSDMAGIKTLATRKGDHYILNGAKTFITNAGIANFYIVFATSDPQKRHGGLSAFIVDGDSPGLTLGTVEDKLGLRASQVGALIFKDVKVPAENLLGAENTGFLIAMQTLDMSRPCLGGAAVGVSRAAYEIALSYARERKQYGRPIIENQGISFMLADMATEIEAARLLTWKAAWLIDQGMDSTKASSMCKVFATEMAESICSRAIQILGAHGYTSYWPVEKYYRDAKAMAIYEGTNQIQRMIIASML